MWRISRPDAMDVLKDKNMVKALSNYFEIMLNRKLSRSKVAFMIEASGIDEDSGDIDDLWDEHERIRNEFHKIYDDEISLKDTDKKPAFSYLDLKIEIANRIFSDCYFCERRCHVDRNVGVGFCGVGDSKIASEFIHVGEEAPLVPSHTIFFAGCTFECVYCQNWDISQRPEVGMSLDEDKLAKIIDRKRMEGSRNVNFVGGDPTPNLLYILKTMRLTEENIPVVWNSNFYMSHETMKLLDGFVDLFLTDFKYGPGECAERLSGIPKYWDIVTRNHKMAKNAGDMIIRHLVLPNHVECCSKPLIKWIYENLGEETVINIMGQYRPVYRAGEYEEIARFPNDKELYGAIDYANDLGLINVML